MYSRRAPRIFFAIIIIITCICYNNCGRVGFEPARSETVLGNPFSSTQASEEILSDVCDLLTGCFPNASYSQCQSGVLADPINTQIGAPASYSTFNDVMKAEEAGAISANIQTQNSCSGAINLLSCSDPTVQNAYNPLSANPYAGVSAMIPVASCNQVFAPAGGSIAFDASTSSGIQNEITFSVTWNHTVTSSGANRILVVGVIGGPLFPLNTPPTPTATYNGIPMIPLIGSGSSNGILLELFYLVNPPTGSNPVTVTDSAGVPWGAFASSYTGVSQTNPIDAQATNTGFSATASTNITTVAPNAWVVMIARSSDQVDPTSLGSYVERGYWDNNVGKIGGTASGVAGIEDSGAAISSPGVQSPSMSFPVNYWGAAAVSLTPF